MRLIAPSVLGLNRFASEKRRWRDERIETLQVLLVSLTSFVALLLATIFSLALFIQADTLVWMIGLFSAAFGLGARPLISDYLTGFGFILEDALDIGEKVEIQASGTTVEGIRLKQKIKYTFKAC